LREWLAEREFTLLIGSHINRAMRRTVLPERVAWVDPHETPRRLIGCSLLISDYSGTIMDFLALDRPVVFFPFDLDEYLKTRRLFTEYENLAFGPIVRTVPDLAALITSGCWKDLEPYRVKRGRWLADVFPRLTPDYSRKTYEAILRLAGGRR
jgi:CDP-glycerol glycerophosphotransferase (TagB/SpsB family)